MSRSGELGFQVRQAVQYRNGAILLRDESNRVHVFGGEKHDEDFSGAFMYELDGNVLRGLSLRAIKSEITAVPTWQHVLGSESDRVVAFTQSDRTRTVGSSARILGDKSVMIRYLNPNLAATISTRGHDTLELRVLDTVTGRIVFQQTHANAAPEPCVYFSNYVVYSYYKTKVQRTEISLRLVRTFFLLRILFLIKQLHSPTDTRKPSVEGSERLVHTGLCPSLVCSLRVLSRITYTTHDSHPFSQYDSNVTKYLTRFALEHRYVRDAELLKVRKQDTTRSDKDVHLGW